MQCKSKTGDFTALDTVVDLVVGSNTQKAFTCANVYNTQAGGRAIRQPAHCSGQYELAVWIPL